MEENNINWWITFVEFLDLNSIEFFWYELKYFIRNIVKFYIKDEFVNGIVRFWEERVDAEKCFRYIRYL